jgi:hypothetical protein
MVTVHEDGPTLTEALLALGIGHRVPAEFPRSLYRREYFRIDTGESLGLMNASEGWAYVRARQAEASR